MSRGFHHEREVILDLSFIEIRLMIPGGHVKTHLMMIRHVGRVLADDTLDLRNQSDVNSRTNGRDEPAINTVD